MECKVFIQTNDEQYLGALVAAYALRRNSRNGDKFSVELLHSRDALWLKDRVGQKFLRGEEHREWKKNDLQSFTPVRFMPPKLMNYQGRAVVIDPDCFAQADIWELFSRDMNGKALMCCWRPGFKDLPGYRASSVMLLDNAKLRHWDAEKTFGELFEFKKDYMKWIKLEYEPDETVGLLEPEWNDFDRLTPQTKILHNTYRRTQPWKTGLPVDFTVRQKKRKPGEVRGESGQAPGAWQQAGSLPPSSGPQPGAPVLFTGARMPREGRVRCRTGAARDGGESRPA